MPRPRSLVVGGEARTDTWLDKRAENHRSL